MFFGRASVRVEAYRKEIDFPMGKTPGKVTNGENLGRLSRSNRPLFYGVLSLEGYASLASIQPLPEPEHRRGEHHREERSQRQQLAAELPETRPPEEDAPGEAVEVRQGQQVPEPA